MIIGCDVPFKKFGYKSLEEFLQNVPSLITRKTENGFYIDARPSEKTHHISDMVNKQKKSKKNTKYNNSRTLQMISSLIFSTLYFRINPKLLSRVTNINRRPLPSSATSANKWRPKNVTNKWKVSYTQSNFPVSHNQFVSYDTQQPPVNNNNVPVVKNNNVTVADYYGATLDRSRFFMTDTDTNSSSSDQTTDTSYRHIDVSKYIKTLSHDEKEQTPLTLTIQVPNTPLIQSESRHVITHVSFGKRYHSIFC